MVRTGKKPKSVHFPRFLHGYGFAALHHSSRCLDAAALIAQTPIWATRSRSTRVLSDIRTGLAQLFIKTTLTWANRLLSMRHVAA